MSQSVKSKTLDAVEQTIETPVKNVDETETVLDRLTDNAAKNILPARYLVEDENGDPDESITDMFQRVAENVSGAEDTPERQSTWEKEFYKQMTELRFMPNSPTLMNAGTPMNQLSACFVLEPEDDMGDIKLTEKDAAMIFKSGGGVGYTFSKLRPKGGHISTTGGGSSGPVSMMQMFDETCEQVKQGGQRRGAQMGIMRVDHPDVGRFAVAKRKEGNLSNFNISIAYTDDFIEAVENGEDYTLFDPTSDFEDAQEVTEKLRHFYLPEFESNPENAYAEGEGAIVKENLWRDHGDEITTVDGLTLREKWADELSLDEDEPMSLPAEFLWDIVVDGAWRNGEPGFFHLDETNREHSFDAEEYPKHEIRATNPCAEQPLSEYEACNLGHINLSLILNEDSISFDDYKKAAHHRTPTEQLVCEYFEASVDFENLDRTIEAGVRFLDNVVTQSDFPIEEIEERVGGQRKIGLGIMGFAQMLYQMGIPYGSDESYEMARCIMRYIDRQGTIESHFLAKDRGSFDYWNESKYANPERYSEWFESHTGLPAEDYEDGFDIRNHNVTTIAPTGTTSMIGNTSGGCEPVYDVANFKNVGSDIQGDDVLVEFDDYFLRVLEENDLDVEAVKKEAESLMRSEDEEFGGVDDLSIPEELKEIFVTTQDLTSEQHGLMQRAFQEFCDSGISKTINLANDATRQDVADAYKLASDDSALGDSIKGLTVYRDGSRDEQVLTTRMDNSLDGEDSDDELLDLYLQGELSEAAARQLGIVNEDDEESDTITCPDCGDGELEKTDDCAVCSECFFSPCN